jgi:ABC-type enterochelin transport system permease subunit
LVPDYAHPANSIEIDVEGNQMDALTRVKTWIGELTEIGLMLLALAIVATLLVGGSLPFFGSVVGNVVAMVKDLGSNGLVGLIALGVILWLFSKRSLA